MFGGIFLKECEKIEMAKKLKVAAYCRVSTDKDEQTNSLESQRKYFRDYIENHPDWILIGVYYDEGISGTQTKKRVGFNEMIEEAFRGNIDLILTKEVSRFARNTVDTLSFTRKLKDHGVGVIFTIDNIDTREPDGELRLTIMASIAQEESRKTSERVKWGQKRKMEQGTVFGRDLLGYKVKDGVLTINEEEVPAVKAIFHKYTNEGKGTHVIARELIEEGLRPKRIALWSNTVILRVLRNEKYVGDLCQKKTITPNYLTHQKKYNRGEEEVVYLTNHHEPIIDRQLWDRTQAELRRRSPAEEQKRKYSNRYWCSGKLECGICGRHFVGRTKKYKDGSTYKAWRCFAAATHGTLKKDADGKEVGCDNQSYNERSLLTAVQYCIQHIQTNFEELKKEIIDEIRAIQYRGEKEVDISDIEKKIEALSEKKRKVLDLMLSGMITSQEAREQNDWYNSKIETLEKQLLSYKEEVLIRQRQAEGMEEYLAALDEIMNFTNFTIAGENQHSEQLCREVVDRIVLYPKGKMHVYLKCLPFAIQLKIQTSGKREDYRTEITQMTVLRNH